jgi:hypothetical protein
MYLTICLLILFVEKIIEKQCFKLVYIYDMYLTICLLILFVELKLVVKADQYCSDKCDIWIIRIISRQV